VAVILATVAGYRIGKCRPLANVREWLPDLTYPNRSVFTQVAASMLANRRSPRRSAGIATD